MGIKNYNPTTPGRRHMTGFTFEEITKDKPYKPLTVTLRKSGGRNNRGRVSARFRGGSHKRRYRIIDFKRDKLDIEGVVESIEYDPNRSGRICLVKYADGDRRYILWPLGLNVGDKIISSNSRVDIKPGNSMLLSQIPMGTVIHNIELRPGKGAQMARSAGSSAQLLAKEGNYAQLRMPSGEIRLVLLSCRATVGQVGNIEHENIDIGKAGRKRWLGKRPHVRGTCMNPIDHPHGGGEGKSHPGRPPVTPWGKPTKGYRTRRNKRTQKFILKRRG